MITLNQTDKVKLEAALKRAEAAELKLTALYQSSVGAHYVVDSDHSRHHVYIWNEPEGAAFLCDCVAHQERNLICRCGAAALADFKEKLEAARLLCAECGIMPVQAEGDLCQLCQQEEASDREEYLMTEVLQPKYQQRTYSWPRKSLEEVEAANPEPEHTKYEESIADARRSLFGD